MAENNLSLKIFLRGENLYDARRISVDASVATSYLFIKEKLETVFPDLRNAQFKITWKDSDNDEITITSDEDFITAFTEMPGNVKVLTIRVIKRCPEPLAFTCTMSEELPRPVIICDACDRTIQGFRYKCLQCSDFDLCTDCEFQGCHSNHVMVRLPNNETYSPKCARKFMHHIARNLKKHACNATKEAYRSTKHASRHSGKCKQSEHTSNLETGHENEPDQQNCPFNLKDVHALGALARENLAQLLESIPSTSQAQTTPEKSDQGAMIFDVLRNAVDTFFGRCPQNQAFVPKTSTENNKTNSKNPDSPMETEVIPSAPVSTDNQNAELVSVESNSTIPTPQNEIVEEPAAQPQWTFVASNQQSEVSAQEPVQESEPKVAFIYHENPVIAEGLVKLHEMGFSNETGVLSSLLEHFNGNVSNVVKAIFDKKI